jgi:hypothetical protein
MSIDAIVAEVVARIEATHAAREIQRATSLAS